MAFLAVALHNATGLFLGYNAARRLGKLSKRKSKAIAFEIGMENSGLAVTLALMNLNPLAAIPGAIFSAWHNVTGSALATYWSNRAEKDDAVDSAKIKAESLEN
jgi:BASS family bile acid:Na+ symporter